MFIKGEKKKNRVKNQVELWEEGIEMEQIPNLQVMYSGLPKKVRQRDLKKKKKS